MEDLCTDNMKVGPSKRLYWVVSAISLVTLLNIASRHRLWLEAQLGSAQAQERLGTYYYAGTVVKKDKQEALKWFQKAAAQRNTHAMYAIGNFYKDGEVVPKDPTQALNWYKRAMQLEVTSSAIKLSGSDTLPTDHLKTYKLIRKAVALNLGKYSVDPGELSWEAARQIVSEYEAGLTSDQVSDAKREVPLYFYDSNYVPQKQP